MYVLRLCLDTFAHFGEVLDTCRAFGKPAPRDAEVSRRLNGVTIDQRTEACTNQKPYAGLQTYKGAR